MMRSMLSLAAVLLALAAVAHAETPVERGRYLVEVLGACGNCHTPKGPQGDLPDEHLAGGFRIEEPFGVAVASNITPDRETGIGAWTDEEIVRAIREGRGRDGRTLGPPMPYYLYRGLSDTDVRAMVAYLRTVPAVRHAVPRSAYVVPLPPSYGPPPGRVPDVPRTDLVRYGEYLARNVAHCADCHTPRTPDQQPDLARLFAGGFPFKGPYGTSFSANLTPDPETGIGRLNDGQIIAGIYGASVTKRALLPPMPAPYYAGKIEDEDLRAIIAYLRTLRPIRNAVPAPLPPGAPGR
jgi:mono/diheme cytochrome c family protein